jgi:hypothetical protein
MEGLRREIDCRAVRMMGQRETAGKSGEEKPGSVRLTTWEAGRGRREVDTERERSYAKTRERCSWWRCVEEMFIRLRSCRTKVFLYHDKFVKTLLQLTSVC